MPNTFKTLYEYKVQKKPKKRPPHNLQFTDYVNWARDAIQMCPEIVFIDKDENVIAVTPDRNTCYGFWSRNQKKGITFKNPRLTSIVVLN